MGTENTSGKMLSLHKVGTIEPSPLLVEMRRGRPGIKILKEGETN
jgi:hypothetical protein